LYDLSHLNFPEVGDDVGRIVLTVIPILPVLFLVTAILGLAFPYEGRKLYATIERAAFCGHFVLGACFQPYPKGHVFGSDINSII
jgi:hypothetical protein